MGGRLLLAAVLATAAIVAVRHVDQPRSAQAVCRIWNTDGRALHAHLEQAGSPASQATLGALGTIAAAPDQLATLMTKLAAVAPMNIAPDFQSLAQAFGQVGRNAAGDPLTALGSGLLLGFTEDAAANRVNAFLVRNCGAAPSSS